MYMKSKLVILISALCGMLISPLSEIVVQDLEGKKVLGTAVVAPGMENYNDLSPQFEQFALIQKPDLDRRIEVPCIITHNAQRYELGSDTIFPLANQDGRLFVNLVFSRTPLEEFRIETAKLMQRARDEGNFKSDTPEEVGPASVKFTNPDTGAETWLGYFCVGRGTNPYNLELQTLLTMIRVFEMELDGVRLHKSGVDLRDHDIDLTDYTNARLFQESNNFISRLSDIAKQRPEESIDALRDKIDTNRIMPQEDAPDNLCVRSGEVIVEISSESSSFRGKGTQEVLEILGVNDFVSAAICTIRNTDERRDIIIDIQFHEFGNKAGLLCAALKVAETFKVEYKD